MERLTMGSDINFERGRREAYMGTTNCSNIGNRQIDFNDIALANFDE
jgi:hypothetical protein